MRPDLSNCEVIGFRSHGRPMDLYPRKEQELEVAVVWLGGAQVRYQTALKPF